MAAASTRNKGLTEDIKSYIGYYMEHENDKSSISFGYFSLMSAGLEDDMIPELCALLAKCEIKIKNFILSMNKISSKGVVELTKYIKQNQQITYLMLNGNQIDDSCLEFIGDVFLSNKDLKHLNIAANKITDKGIEILMPYMLKSNTVQSLFLANNQGITDASLPFLERLVNETIIENISVSATSISNSNIYLPKLLEKRLANTINKDGQITLSQLNIKDDDIPKICEVIKKFGDDILRINLSENNITSKGASILVRAASEFRKLEFLEMQRNLLDDKCLDDVADLISTSSSLKLIDISANDLHPDYQFSDEGISILLPCLIGNTTLNTLHLRYHKKITEKSMDLFRDLVNKSCLKQLKLDGTSISSSGQKEIDKLTKLPIDHREFIIQSNSKSAAKIE